MNNLPWTMKMDAVIAVLALVALVLFGIDYAVTECRRKRRKKNKNKKTHR